MCFLLRLMTFPAVQVIKHQTICRPVWMGALTNGAQSPNRLPFRNHGQIGIDDCKSFEFIVDILFHSTFYFFANVKL
jgi:hypothetical protein